MNRHALATIHTASPPLTTYVDLRDIMTPQEILRKVSELKLEIEHLAGAPSVWTLAAYLASMAEQEVISILYNYEEHRLIGPSPSDTSDI